MVDQILARLKKLGTQILEWWKKFAMRQKIIIIGVTLGVIAALVILVAVLSRSQYTFLIQTDTSADGAEVRDLLVEAGIKYTMSDDGCTFYVEKGSEGEANLTLGSSGFVTQEYTVDQALSGGISTTESDKAKKYVQAMQSQMESDLQAYDFVKKAIVQLTVPENDGTLIAQNEDTSAAVILTLRGDFTTDMAANMAKFIATGLGNEDTSKVTILDSTGKLYFSGEEEVSLSGAVSSQVTMRQSVNSVVEADVKKVLSGIGEFSGITVSPNMDIDFSTLQIALHNYEAQEGRDEGLYSHTINAEAESTNGGGGVPGTTSNTEDQTGYVLDEAGESNQTESESEIYYLPNEYTSLQDIPPGAVQTANSTIAVTAVHYNVIYEDMAELNGLSWDEYKRTNTARTKLEVDEDWINTVAMATGIPAANISFVAYEENWFVDDEGFSVNVTDVVQIVLIVLILALLAFVVIRSMKNVKQQEQEEELSVESLLQSTPEPALENIEVEEKSNARRIIEKFVDENPDAVANLLRNWLSEDWG